ncbi:uncharacterized protein F5Z01DRAFT_349628 [Emericellopsis atlantica]|uniref:HNH nuclease domain-containing protein n=1 Tax=Emericellopsis atlantica TaxID=2614577 RepID=A0A9P7ZEQ3_9HYPO|nr:uncharacterized protein F5Z01DRAFT_349628 [Emericellopsis atlantica]KAG9250630.1 hypothetical protein F5Z01DRAFT_349628 [Emericellopsis atlantica]
MPVRPPLEPPPNTDTGDPGYIDFRHPAYPDSEAALLRFAAIDGDHGDGVDFEVALVACGIITGNTWHCGYIAEMDTGGGYVKVDKSTTDVLRRRTYYYFVDEQRPGYKYPVIPSFDHWRFPHRNLPFAWKNINMPQASRSMLKRKIAAQDRDGTCRISRHASALEVAHFVPVADEKWFASNKMDQYVKSGSETRPTEDPTNLITLRRDIHYLFDTRRFTFVPKQDTARQEWSLALHVFAPDENPDLIPLYHNRSPAPLSGISIEHVFARFAWTIFSEKTLRFFKGVAEYVVLLFDPQAGKVIETKLRSPEVRMSLKIFSSSSRTPSPKKRPRDQSAEDDQFWGEERDDVSVASDWDPPRGRRRERSWDYCNSNSPPG